MPAMFISGYSDLGNSESWNPAFRNDQSYTFNTNMSWTKGKHDMRFGFDFVHHLMNHWQPELGEGPRGAFHFDPGVTALNPEDLEGTVGFEGDTPSFENDWNGLAGFLLGTPTATGKSSQFIKMNSLENQWAFYGRDRWAVNSKLTLDLGLRWELYPNRHRSAGLGIESYDPTTNEALIGGRGESQDNNVGWSKKLSPPVWFAYQMNESTVIRGATDHLPFIPGALRRCGWFPLTVIAVFEGTNGFAPVTTSPGSSLPVSRTPRWGPRWGFLRSAAPTSARGGFRCQTPRRRDTRSPISCCIAATSSRGI
jgi:hypothetical protein